MAQSAAPTQRRPLQSDTDGAQAPSRPPRRRVVMLLENFTYPQDTRVRNEAESLASAGHHVTVIAPRAKGQPARERLAGVAVRRYRGTWARSSLSSYALEYGIAHVQLLARALWQLLWGAEIVHVHGPPDTLALAAALARAGGRKLVYDMHDSAPELFEAKFGPSFPVSALRLIQRASASRADHVIVTNESQRALLLQRMSRSPPLTVVRNGPRLAEFPTPRAGRGGRLYSPRLIYVGTLDVQDGVLALPDLLRASPLAHARLTIVGDGGARAELTARLQAARVLDRVQLLGRVEHHHVCELIGDADIAIDPAPGSELNHGSTMIKIAEYMAGGRPTVAYDLRETRRSAADTALYAPCDELQRFAELIAALAADGERRVRLGAMARQRALSLTWEHSERALLGVYEHLDATGD